MVMETLIMEEARERDSQKIELNQGKQMLLCYYLKKEKSVILTASFYGMNQKI